MRPLNILSLLFALASGALAAIDSGGGLSDLGSGTNHSSIGAPLATGGSVAGLIEILYPPAPALDPEADTDGDGLLDSWEEEHFGNLTANATADADADADGDGTTNLMEYLAGTDPRSGTSVFRPSSRVESGKLILTVPTVSDRSYRVWGTSNLQTTWTAHDTISGDGSTIAWEYLMSQSATSRYFLKIEILIPTN